MKNVTLAEIAEAVHGEIPFGGHDLMVTDGVNTDTRQLNGGELYIALRGENFDGHDFVAAAFEKGAIGAFVEDATAAQSQEGIIVVEDTLMALQRLAHWWRETLAIPTVGLTGSNGKTSTKDFTRSVLSQRFQVRATKGNLNNHIGVPLSVLSLTPEDEIGVFEMGMNHAGEIAPLCEIARPHLGIITNIGTAHLENLITRDNIAKEKGSLARSLPEVGTLILPASCDYFDYFRERTPAAVLAVGNGRGQIRAERIESFGEGMKFVLVIEGLGEIVVQLSVLGRHMVTNALLAAATGHVLGLSMEEIAQGLEETVLTSGRLRAFNHDGIAILDDTYNANPESMCAGIDTLVDRAVSDQGRRFAVLGKMAELGPTAEAEHRRVGAYAAKQGLIVVSIGEEAAEISIGAGQDRHFQSREEAADWLRKELKSGDAVLFKGSRAAKVEQVMNQIFPSE